jgi:hypothetical protein
MMFKQGDEVICVDASGYGVGRITEGGRYRIKDYDGECYALEDATHRVRWRQDRFKLADPCPCHPCATSITISDPINPSHYKQGEIECIEVLEALGIAIPFCRGTAIKYLYRTGAKEGNSELQEAKKAAWYVNRLVSILEKAEAKNENPIN